MQTKQEHFSVNHMNVVNADNAGVFICEVLLNQALVLETGSKLIFLGLFLSAPITLH